MKHPGIWPQFYTATIQNWKPLLSKDEYKSITTDCLAFLVNDNRIVLNAFVVMNNHVHLIWQPLHQYSLTQMQSSFMSFTAKSIIKNLALNNPDLLESIRVHKHDRRFQVWKREPLSIELFTQNVFIQKLNYIHNNPVMAGLVSSAEEYAFSSAA